MINTKGIQLFLEDLKIDCKKNKIKLKMFKGQTVPLDDGRRGSGYFDTITIAVAKGRIDWLSILIHESCHLDQWVQKAKVWTQDERWCNGSGIIDEWLSGKHYPVKSVRRAILRAIKLELDCERRALVKIAEYNLPINTTSYIQKANAYILSYHRVLATRKWKAAIYDDTILFNRMPEKLMSDRYYMKERFSKYFCAAGL